MIRYVLAVLLTVVLVTTASAGLERVSAVRGEQQVENQLAKIDATAVSLIESDDVPPPGQVGPRRVVTIELPEDGLTSASVDRLVFDREANATIVRYRLDGRQPQSFLIDAPIVNAATGEQRLELGGRTSTVTIILVLSRSSRSHSPVVEVTVES